MSALLSTVLVAGSGPLASEVEPAGASMQTQRAAFLAAEAARKAGALDRYREIAGGLVGYPLYPYLRYEELVRASPAPADQEIRRFLAEYPDSHLADRLRAAWLMRLAGAGRWADYVEAYRPDGSEERQCLYRRALLETGRQEDAVGGLEGPWLHAEPSPAACGPV